MTIAPEPILRAVNETVAWACIFCRNHTARDPLNRTMLNQAMDAIHEVPRMVLDWERHDLDEVRTHFGCFPASRWPGAPDLVLYFNERLRENLEASWSKIREHLRSARSLLPESSVKDSARGSLANFDQFLDHNELELALDEIEGVGEQSAPPAEFWLALSDAAAQMGLGDRATQLASRAA
jgi:hypothetical protein